MLEEIKKIQGISHKEFDSIINVQIDACKADLKAIGIVKDKVNDEDSLIRSTIYTYVLSFLDVSNSEMYLNAYNLQKDYLRHLSEYQKEDK